MDNPHYFIYRCPCKVKLFSTELPDFECPTCGAKEWKKIAMIETEVNNCGEMCTTDLGDIAQKAIKEVSGD